MRKSFTKYGLLFLLWTRRDLHSRYAGSAAGLLWAVLQPLATIGIFYFVFAVILQVRIPELANQSGYFLYLLTGLLPWLSIGDGLLRGASSLTSQEQFLSRTPFPIDIMPVSVVITSFLPQLVGTLVLVLLVGMAGLLEPLKVLLLWPLLVLVQLAMTIGVGCSLAMLSVHLRDTTQALPVILQMIFYATPIIYPKSLIPAEYQNLFLLNPVACLLDVYQWLFLGLALPTVVLIALLGWFVVLAVGGWWLFRALKPTLGDYL